MIIQRIIIKGVPLFPEPAILSCPPALLIPQYLSPKICYTTLWYIYNHNNLFYYVKSFFKFFYKRAATRVSH
jgi:hypothetical protein